MHLDHIIVNVNDAAESLAFYEAVLGFVPDGMDGPFSVLRVEEGFTMLLAPWGTKGGGHFAFAMDAATFDATFARLREKSIPFGDSYHVVGNGKGPGLELGAKGMGEAVYFFDPNKHLLEIRTYDRKTA